jgi:hypothetical protein
MNFRDLLIKLSSYLTLQRKTDTLSHTIELAKKCDCSVLVLNKKNEVEYKKNEIHVINFDEMNYHGTNKPIIIDQQSLSILIDRMISELN